jgi:DNA-binding transcriptional LysR family regulator
MRLPPDGLVAFAAVIDEGGVSHAARALNVTQPAISNRMRALQAIVGAPLYERRGGQTIPTEIGAKILPHARAVAHALDRAMTELADTHAPIRISISEAATPLIAPRLARLTHEYPAIEVEVSFDTGTSIVEGVVAGRIDIGVTTATPYVGAEHLDRSVILIDEILLLRPAGNPVTETTTSPISIDDVTILWQARTSGVRATVERALEMEGLAPRASLELGSTPAALYATATGGGCCFSSRLMATPWLQAGLVETAPLEIHDLYARIEVITQSADLLPVHQRRVREALLTKHYHE